MRRIFGFLAAALLMVCGTIAMADNQDLANQIEKVLIAEGNLTTQDKFTLNVQNGVVLFKGDISTESQKQRVEELARTVPGVIDVQNELTAIKKATLWDQVIGRKAPEQVPSAVSADRMARNEGLDTNLTANKQPMLENTTDRFRIQPVSASIIERSVPDQQLNGSVYQTPAPMAAPMAAPIAAQVAAPVATPVATPVAYQTGQISVISDRPVSEVQPTPTPAAVADVPATSAPAAQAPVAYAQAAQTPMPMNGTPAYTMPAPNGQNHAVRYDQPYLPNYAWPTYAAYPNYSAVTYPKRYCAQAWPYIPPAYPYPQVPLGWREISIQWHDGGWEMDYNDGSYKAPGASLFRPFSRY